MINRQNEIRAEGRREDHGGNVSFGQAGRNRFGCRRCLAALVLALTLTLGSMVTAYAEVSQPPVYLCAATYASDAWVINFWNTESDHMDEELAQIAADGFNSIILVIPWREFQPTTDPVSYNDYAFQKLDQVMQAARQQGLWVETRISYTWDYYAEEDCKLRFRELLGGGAVREAWLDYVRTLYDFLSGYPNFYGGFITWEDFWNYMEDVPVASRGTAGIEEAERIGYQDYLREYYMLETLDTYYQRQIPFSDYTEIPIPGKESPAYRLLYDFYDDFLIGLLQEAQEVFPDLSMEVRLDVDPVNGTEGGKVGAHHFRTFPCSRSSYTSLMYSVSMGQENKGERITAETALATMESQLALVEAYNAGKPIFIDQLLYMDSTEAFSHNAQLYEEERNLFLTSLPPVLRKYTNGYAVWSYRNYGDNAVYNSQFALGDRGWSVHFGQVEEHDGSSQMHLQTKGSIEQTIGSRVSGAYNHDNMVRFTADSTRPVTVSVTLGNITREVQVMGSGSYELNFGALGYETVRIRADGEVWLDNIQVYNFVQDGQLYDMDGKELSSMEAVRELNRAMQ